MIEKEYKRLSEIAVGETLIRPVFVDKIEENRTNGGKGDPYVSFTFSDSTGSIKANKFRDCTGKPVTIEILKDHQIVEGIIVTAALERTEKGFLNVAGINPFNVDADVSLKDFAHKVEGSSDERYNNIISILKMVNSSNESTDEITKKSITDIALQIYEENEQKIKWSAAAEIMHSEMAGGLLEHTEAMVRNAVKLCEVYPDLDRELLVVATALHDVGKIEEMETNPLGRASYMPAGIGLGHIVLGFSYIDRIFQKNPDDYPEERVFLLESLILSHHGKLEWGSPVEPIVKEAFMLHYLDQMDAKYHEMNKATNTLKPGEISANSNVLGIKHRIYRRLEE